MFFLAIGFLLFQDTPPSGRPADARCPECRADLASIRAETRALRSSDRLRDRVEAAEALAPVRWQCHPEAVDALVEALQTDKKGKVRAEAARSLGRMVPNLPASHVGLVGASRSDPEAPIRNQARKALAVKGLRCVVDCPICGPLPAGAAITGPSVLLPEWGDKPEKAETKPNSLKPTPSLPPALPDPAP